MNLTSRRRSEGFQRRQPFRDAKIIVVATEGSVTEPHYLSMFDQADGVFFNPRVKRLSVLGTGTKGESSPNHVINRLLEYRESNDIGGDDQLWLVIDVDRWKKQGILDAVIAESRMRSIRLAISNPCFEVWLLCHKLETLPSAMDFKKISKRELGNVKQAFNLAPYASTIKQAIATARLHDIGNDACLPAAVGTHVYKLIAEIVPEHLR